jgi:hypothetical protein
MPAVSSRDRLRGLILQYAIAKRANKKSICNLCRGEADLTWDHVPPKGGILVRPVEIQTAMTRLTGRPARGVISQNGVKYRTICKRCNDHIGAEYDPTMNAFSKSVGRYVKSTLRVPNVVRFATKPQRLLKALLAHLVAAKVEIEDTTFDRAARGYALDPTAKLPDDITVFYWVYPYDETVVMRDFAMFTPRGTFKQPAVFQLLKSFPVAFLCSTASTYDGLDRLSLFRRCELDEEVEIPVRLLPAREPHWPETPTDRDNSIIFGGSSAMQGFHARPRRRLLRV